MASTTGADASSSCSAYLERLQQQLLQRQLSFHQAHWMQRLLLRLQQQHCRLHLQLST